MWHTKLGDIAEVDKVAYTSPPPAKATNPSAAGAQNPLIHKSYPGTWTGAAGIR